MGSTGNLLVFTFLGNLLFMMIFLAIFLVQIVCTLKVETVCVPGVLTALASCRKWINFVLDVLSIGVHREQKCVPVACPAMLAFVTALSCFVSLPVGEITPSPTKFIAP